MSKITSKPSPVLLPGPWSPAWWRSALAEMGSFRTMVLAALLLALRIVVSSFFIPLGDNLRVYFSFFVTGLTGVLLGPLWALLYGMASDLLGFVIHPTGGFFPGYVLTAMMGAFTYALFLYRARITILRIFLCKLAVNLLVNVGLGALWSSMIYGKGYLYYLAKSIVKNLVMLPIETAFLALFLGLMLPVTAQLRLTPPQPGRRIPWF